MSIYDEVPTKEERNRMIPCELCGAVEHWHHKGSISCLEHRISEDKKHIDNLKARVEELEDIISRLEDNCKGSLQIGDYKVEWDGVDDIKVTTPYRLSYHICGGDFQGLLSSISDVRRIKAKAEGENK